MRDRSDAIEEETMEIDMIEELDYDIDEHPRVKEYSDGKIDPETGEQMEADPSAEYNIFAVANWYENGEHVVFTFAEF